MPVCRVGGMWDKQYMCFVRGAYASQLPVVSVKACRCEPVRHVESTKEVRQWKMER
jgi:hypothetical protein